MLLVLRSVFQFQFDKFYQEYGKRAQLAAENKGIDWKAVSHAFRACYQLKEIYITGNLVYPLKDALYLKHMKEGLFHFKNDGIGEKLNDMALEIEALANKSSFPEKVDQEAVEKLVLSCYKK